MNNHNIIELKQITSMSPIISKFDWIGTFIELNISPRDQKTLVHSSVAIELE